MRANKKIEMWKNGELVKWDGSDVSSLVITEYMTMAELKTHFPKQYKAIKKKAK